jgi:hypothetical protein
VEGRPGKGKPMTKLERVLRVLDAALHGMAGRLGEWLYIDAAKAEQRAAVRKRIDETLRRSVAGPP